MNEEKNAKELYYEDGNDDLGLYSIKKGSKKRFIFHSKTFVLCLCHRDYREISFLYPQ